MNLYGNVPPIIIKVFERIVNYINNAKLKDPNAIIKGNIIIQDIYCFLQKKTMMLQHMDEFCQLYCSY